jgi:hypothetical protein
MPWHSTRDAELGTMKATTTKSRIKNQTNRVRFTQATDGVRNLLVRFEKASTKAESIRISFGRRPLVFPSTYTATVYRMVA